jgi:transmembrane sensor
MKNVVEFPDTTSVREEAIAWLIKLDDETPLSSSDHERLHEWTRRSPFHRQQLKEVVERWGRMNVLTDLAVPLGHLNNNTSGGRPRSGIFVRIAAVAASIVGGLLFGYSQLNDELSLADSNGYYATAVGEQETARLSDGSVVLLNTGTRIRVDYSEGSRDVHLLQGEAHFTVEKNPESRFRVFAGGGRIDALGTSFSVYLKESSVDVTVTEGLVALGTVSSTLPRLSDAQGIEADLRPDSTVQELGTLAAGQIATITDLKDPDFSEVDALDIRRDVQQRDLLKRLSWTEGSLVFSGEPLKDVVKEISRYTTVTIDFSDPSIGAIPVGGTFPVGETDAMFKMLEISFGLDVSYLSDSHVLVSSSEQ